MYTLDNQTDLVIALAKGERCQINRDLFLYWLEVLPPVAMRCRVRLVDGIERQVSYCAAEGSSPITAFWIECDPVQPGQPMQQPAYLHGAKKADVRYFAQQATTIVHTGPVSI